MHPYVNFAGLFTTAKLWKPSTLLYNNDCVCVCMCIMADAIYFSHVVKKTMVHVVLEKKSNVMSVKSLQWY